LFQKRIYSIFLGTLVGKRKQTIFEKRWFDITKLETSNASTGTSSENIGQPDTSSASIVEKV
jgi:hypothetical protein